MFEMFGRFWNRIRPLNRTERAIIDLLRPVQRECEGQFFRAHTIYLPEDWHDYDRAAESWLREYVRHNSTKIECYTAGRFNIDFTRWLRAYYGVAA